MDSKLHNTDEEDFSSTPTTNPTFENQLPDKKSTHSQFEKKAPYEKQGNKISRVRVVKHQLRKQDYIRAGRNRGKH